MPRQKISRDDLLTKAWRLFHRHGYYDTSLQLIASATGLGKAGLLHHFGSKQHLMEAVIAFARTYYTVRVLSELHGDAPLPERLRRFLDHHVRLCQLDRRGCFFANTILETGADRLFSAQLEQFHIDWIAAVRDALLPHYPAAEAAERAYRLFTDYEGSVVIYKIRGKADHLHRFVDRAVTSLVHPIYFPA